MPTLHELTRDSQNDHHQPCPSCWHTASQAVAAGKLKNSEADAVLRQMAELANKSDQPPPWDLVFPLMAKLLHEYYRAGGNSNGDLPGDRAVPGMTALIDRMGHAADAAN
jgi:hypothetical protein